MSNFSKQDVTLLLTKLKQGDKNSQEELIKVLYNELRSYAGNVLKKENPTITFQATELVNEAYLRMFDSQNLDWNDKSHFISTAIIVMRRFLVDHARKKHSDKKIKKNGCTLFKPFNKLKFIKKEKFVNKYTTKN